MSIAYGLMSDSPSPEESAVASSSIGNNSDADEENDEAQSSYKGPLDMTDALEDVLPIRRGISRFYNYKSKSFTSLADASSTSSVKEIAKPDNLYTRRRRNLLASNLNWDKKKNRSFHCRGGGIAKSSSKKTITASRSTLALAVVMSSASGETSPSSSDDSDLRSPTCPFPSSKAIGNHAAWRSLSLAYLQECAASAASRFLPSKLNLQNQLFDIHRHSYPCKTKNP